MKILTDDFVFHVEEDGSLRRGGLRLYHWIAPVAFALILIAMIILMGETIDLSTGLLIIPGLFLTLTIIRLAAMTGAPRLRIDRSAQRIVLNQRGVVSEIPFSEIIRFEYHFQPDKKKKDQGRYLFMLGLTMDRGIPIASLSGSKARIDPIKDRLNAAVAQATGKTIYEIP